ncbi:MAG: hypothetical protein Q7S57_06320 [bacterium]|nr:hypothetical protein [bacterium]
MPLSMSIPSLSAFLDHLTSFTDTLVAQATRDMLELAEIGENPLFGYHLSKIVHDTLCIGQTFCDYDDHDPSEFGFGTQGALTDALHQIQKKWAGQIGMEWDGETVNYRAHIPGPSEKVESVLFAQFVHGTDVTSQEFDEDLFMAGLLQAAGQGGKPLDVLRVMADQGFNTVNRQSPEWQKFIGQE